MPLLSRAAAVYPALLAPTAKTLPIATASSCLRTADMVRPTDHAVASPRPTSLFSSRLILSTQYLVAARYVMQVL